MKSPKAIVVILIAAVLLSIGAWYRAGRAEARAGELLQTLQARLGDLEKQLQTEAQRANAAEAESATLLKAIDETRSVGVAAPAPSVRQSPAPEVMVPGVTNKAPQGWNKNGNKPEAYTVGVDSNQMWNGLPSAYAKSGDAAADAFGGMMQTISADDFLGKRVRLSGWMKTEDANDGGGHLWLRVDGQQQGKILEFDNMNNRAPKGTTGWQQYSVVLDVAPDARALAYGFFVQGKGQVWVNNSKLEVIERDVPSTSMLKATQALPKQPANPTFQ
jgi:hypothetical protein